MKRNGSDGEVSGILDRSRLSAHPGEVRDEEEGWKDG